MRISTHNPGGTLDNLHLQQRPISSTLARTDILCVSESGSLNSNKDTLLIPGFLRIYSTPRPYDPEHGGVAVFARQLFSKSMKVVRESPEMGMVWIRLRNPLGGRDVYICALYLPHERSTYYKHEDGALKFENHMAELTRSIEFFSALGDILIVGDMNARMGTLDDRPDGDLGELIPEGALLDTPESRIACLAPPRQSLDPLSNINPNRHGKLLMQHVIKPHLLLILNGRTPGDMQGNQTFHANGQGRSSLIDYFISTPSLVFDNGGAALPNTRLTVSHPSSIHTRPGGGRFDHSFLTLTFPLSSSPALPPPTEASGTPCERFVWRGRHRSSFVETLLSQPTLLSPRPPTLEASSATLSHTLKQTIRDLKSQGKHLTPSPPAAHRPANSWFNDECKAAATLYKLCPSLTNYKSYKRLARRTKRVWETELARTRMDALFRDPKRFWAAYRGIDHKDPHFSTSSWTKYFSALFSPPPPSPDPPAPAAFPQPSPSDLAAADHLNEPFALTEILEALDHVKLGKAPGLDGLPMEFIKHACPEGSPAFAELLLHTFNLALASGSYPKEWGIGALAPVPKPKGNPDKRDDYRGIAVGQAISKLYSLVLLRRLTRWSEASGHRAAGQAGFRPGRGTGDNVFILNHMLEKHTYLKKTLYVAFIDFRKAYDSVDRSVLWAALSSLGLHGPALAAIKAMYADVLMAVRQGRESGELFEALMGVKQGDPLSPLLFGLLIDRLEPYLKSLHPDIGAQVLDAFIHLLLYADDLCLIAEHPHELQTLLNSLHSFCIDNKLTVNAAKSEVVAFLTPLSFKPPAFTFGESTVPLRDQFTYLGVAFDRVHALKNAWQRNTEMGARASFQVARTTNTLEMYSPLIRTHAFNTMALPVLAYGGEVWGPQALSSTSSGGPGPQLDQILSSFLKRSLGLPPTTPTVTLKLELGFIRPSSRILKYTLKFHNTILSRPPHDLARMALTENKALAAADVPCWSLYLHNILSKDTSLTSSLSSAPLDPSRARKDREENLDKKLLSKALTLRSSLGPNQSLHDLPDAASTGFKTLKYLLWFQPPPDSKQFAYHSNSRTLTHTLARFRLSMTSLRCEKGRPLPRSSRTCELCHSSSIEDEWHLIKCPAYQNIRSAPDLQPLIDFWAAPTNDPPSDADIHRFLNPKEPTHCHLLALLLLRCLKHRRDALAPPPPL